MAKLRSQVRILCVIALLASAFTTAEAARSTMAIKKIDKAPSGDDGVLFTCTTSHKDAFVRLTGKSGQPSGVQYVSLADGKPEFTYPATPDLTGAIFHYSWRGYAGGGEDHITFRNGLYTYVAYDKTTTGSNLSLPDFNAGIIVLWNGKVISRRKCEDGGSINEFAARSHLKSEAFVEVPGIP